jgi:hypothetical protein
VGALPPHSALLRLPVRYLVRVSSELGHIALRPLHREALVHEPVVGVAKALVQLVDREPSEDV